EQLCEIFWWASHDVLRYKPFGVLASKRWLFERGGRPVIYQSDEEYDVLPDAVRYRHVRYEPTREPPIDFTWEREWRACTASLALNPQSVRIIVPASEYAAELVRLHDQEQNRLVEQYSYILGDDLAEMHREAFQWNVVNLDDLRPDWHFDRDPPSAR